jgi:hypothetical protein
MPPIDTHDTGADTMNHLTNALTAWDAAMQRLAPVTMFHADCGRRRGYLSSNDARAYERGFDQYPAPLPASEQGPMRDGWRDAKAEAAEAVRALVEWQGPRGMA